MDPLSTLVCMLLAVDLRGRVLDANTKEPLEAVRVTVVDGPTVRTDARGEFVVPEIGANANLRVSLPNYALLKQSVPADGAELEIFLQPDAGTIASSINVTAAVFDLVEGPGAPSEYTLNKTELQALGTNLVSDPLRSVQALPGVTVADDFRGEISIRGAGFGRTAIVLDGIYLDGFLHLISGDAVGNDRDRGSFSIVPTDRIAEIGVLPAAFPARHGFVTGGVVSLATREGNRRKIDTRISTGLQFGTSLVADGPLGRRAAFLVGYRSSALDYLSRLIDSEDTGGSAFDDGQVKLTLDVSNRHSVGFSAIGGRFRIDDRKSTLRLGPNTATKQDSVNGMGVLSWDWTVTPQVVARSRLFLLQTGLRARNSEAILLSRQPQAQFGGRQDWLVSLGRHRVEAGTYIRAVDAEGEAQAFLPGLLQPVPLDRFRGSTMQRAFYTQDSVTLSGNLTLTVAGRLENDRLTRQTLLAPRLGLAWRPRGGWALRSGFGRHSQFASLPLLLSQEGNRALQAQRSSHYTLGLEVPVGERSRILVEGFRREDRSEIFRLNEPRIVGGRPISPDVPPLNSVDGHTQGFEVMLQRRSGNRFSGWGSYGYMRSRLRESNTGLVFPSDFDQRHTATLFGMYRLSPSMSLNSIWRYGSGQPQAGFFRKADGQLFLGDQRNQLRLRSYGRWDLRLNKSLHLGPSRWVFVLEAINLLNRGNRSFVGLEAFDPFTGRVLNETSLNQIGRGYSAGVILQF